MQAILLTAGMGSRLKPFTEEKPKSMVEIHGKALIEYMFDQLIDVGVNEVILIVGYKKECIIQRYGEMYKNLRLTYIENQLYESTNNVYSLYMAKGYIDDEVLLVEGDVFLEKSIMNKMIGGQTDCGILVSRFNPETMNGSIIRCDEDMAVKQLIIKRDQQYIQNIQEYYKTVNAYYFSKEFFVEKYMPLLEYYINSQSRDSYYELVLGALIYFGNNTIKAIEIPEESWYEIDDLADYQKAQQGFRNLIAI